MTHGYTEAMVLHLSQALEDKLTAAARRRGVSIEALAHEALERALDYDDWFIGEVESGFAQAETGRRCPRGSGACS
jgi:predicted transcriptional regulator